MREVLKNYRTYIKMVFQSHQAIHTAFSIHEQKLREAGANYDAEAYAEARDQVIANHRTHTLKGLQNCKNYLLDQYSDIKKYVHKSETELSRSTEEVLETHQLKADKEASQ